MVRIGWVRAMRSVHAPGQSVRLVPLLALWMSLAVGVPAASAQQAPELWSMQLDAGLFTPIEASGASPSVGVRYCKHFGSHLQGGMLTGWTFKNTSVEAPTGGLQSNESHVELARVEARLTPLMMFMQVDLTDRSWLVPFAGIGAGYEWLRVDAEDHRTGQKSVVKYGNVAWEAYTGIGLRLTSRVRLNNELFYNGGSLESSVLDSSGHTWREAVHVNGVGARVGLDMIFE
jgi:opacity protein-like surface antigen